MFRITNDDKTQFQNKLFQNCYLNVGRHDVGFVTSVELTTYIMRTGTVNRFFFFFCIHLCLSIVFIFIRPFFSSLWNNDYLTGLQTNWQLNVFPLKIFLYFYYFYFFSIFTKHTGGLYSVPLLSLANFNRFSYPIEYYWTLEV